MSSPMPKGSMRGMGPGGGHGTMPAEKPKDAKGTLRRLFSFMHPYRFSVLLVLLCAIASVFCSSLGPMVLGFATNEIQLGAQRMLAGTGGIDLAAVVRKLTQLGALYAASALFSYLQQYAVAGVSQKTMYSLRRAVDLKIKRLPLSYFDSNTIGDVLSRTSNDVDTVANSLQQGISQLFNSVITIITVLAMMLLISPGLTLAALLTLPFTLLSSMKIVKSSQKFFRGQADTLGDLNGYIEEMYTGHQVVRAFSREESAAARFDQLNERLCDYSWKANFISGVIMPVSGFFGNLGYIIITVIGAFLCIDGRFLVGSIQSFIQYIRSFNMPITQTANLANMLQSTMAAAERVFQFLDEAEETPDAPGAKAPENTTGTVEFKNVSFGYAPDRVLIKKLSLSISPGEMIAIVGPTGAGKTTLVNLVLRFYDVLGGQILVDGMDVRDMPRAALRDRFGMVLQDTWLFSGSIRENIRYGRLNASDEEVYAAARAARADGFIRSLPRGYDTELGEDASNISQGQRQLITIARAILSEPEILIWDEATSSVDTRTELLIQRAMGTLMKGRTSFVIAHRLSTIRDADKILVMNHGDIVETGNHRELMAKNGFYASLYRSQFEGGEEAV